MTDYYYDDDDDYDDELPGRLAKSIDDYVELHSTAEQSGTELADSAGRTMMRLAARYSAQLIRSIEQNTAHRVFDLACEVYRAGKRGDFQQ